MNMSTATAFLRAVRILLPCITGILLFILLSGCKKEPAVSANAPAPQESAAPGPAPTPTEPIIVQPADNGNIDATLAELTHELHKAMVGRRLKRDFDEFVAIRNVKVPPPPPGKKYAIDSHWKVILVNK
jgi:hypothetical protein